MSETTQSTDHEILSDLLPDAGGVQLVPNYDDEIAHPNYLVIDAQASSAHDPGIVATVEHRSREQGAKPSRRKTVIVVDDPIDLQAATEAALRYAEENRVPVIFLNQDAIGMNAEEQLKAAETGDERVMARFSRFFRRQPRTRANARKAS